MTVQLMELDKVTSFSYYPRKDKSAKSDLPEASRDMFPDLEPLQVKPDWKDQMRKTALQRPNK